MGFLETITNTIMKFKVHIPWFVDLFTPPRQVDEILLNESFYGRLCQVGIEKFVNVSIF